MLDQSKHTLPPGHNAAGNTQREAEKTDVSTCPELTQSFFGVAELRAAKSVSRPHQVSRQDDNRPSGVFVRDRNSVSEVTGWLAGSALHIAAFPFRAIAQATLISQRLANPFSSAQIWSGKPHPKGHSPLKMRALLHVGTALSAITLFSLPRDYTPLVGSAVKASGTDNPPKAAEANGQVEPVAAYVNAILGDIPDEGLPVNQVLQRFPNVQGIEQFAYSNLVSLEENLSPKFIRNLFLAQPGNTLSLEEAQKKFPHLSESAYFQTRVSSGRTQFNLSFLLRCEETRQSSSTSAITLETERVFAETIDANPFMSEMRRHRVFGPMIDKILSGAAEDLANSPYESGTENTFEILKRGIFKRSRQHVIDHGTPAPLIERFDESIEEIDRQHGN